MATKAIYERFLWFHSRVMAGSYPNASTLAARFEISPKTARRDIDFMHDRLRAPLVYDQSRRGYSYEEDGFALPGIWIDEKGVVSLLLAESMLEAVPDREQVRSLDRVLGDIIESCSTSKACSLRKLKEKVSLRNIGYCRTEGVVFHQVLDALVEEREIEIEYYSPHKKETSSRRIVPLRLVCYMGTWHLIAHCRLRGELRDFSLSRIMKISPSNGNPFVESPEIEDFLEKTFGIFSSGSAIEVKIRFGSDIADWVSELVWHEDQSVIRNADGSIVLSFPVSDFTEIKREILKFGHAAEVLAPETLREEMRDEIEKMNRIYT